MSVVGGLSLDISDGGPGAGSLACSAVELAALQGIVDAHGGTVTVTESGTGGALFAGSSNRSRRQTEKE